MYVAIGSLLACSANSEPPPRTPVETVEQTYLEPVVTSDWAVTRIGNQKRRTLGEHKPPPETPRLLMVWFKLENTGKGPVSPQGNFVVIDGSGKQYDPSAACMAQPVDAGGSGVWFDKVAVGEHKRVKLCYEVPGDDVEEFLWLTIRTPEKNVKIKI